MKSESKRRAAPTAADDAAVLGDDESESPLVRSRSQRALSRGDTRRALVWCGTELLTERGFQVTGIDEVLKRVGVPKGSFYHFFASKHAFGEAVIQNYVEYYARKMDRIFDNPVRTPLARLHDFVEDAKRGMQKYGYRRGCLIGNLGQELASLDDAFRDQLEDAGLVISGLSPDERLVEMVELPRDVHPWYVATQAHPEFKSRPTNPQPLFREFVRASIGQHEGVDRLQVTPMNLATD